MSQAMNYARMPDELGGVTVRDYNEFFAYQQLLEEEFEEDKRDAQRKAKHGHPTGSDGKRIINRDQ